MGLKYSKLVSCNLWTALNGKFQLINNMNTYLIFLNSPTNQHHYVALFFWQKQIAMFKQKCHWYSGEKLQNENKRNANGHCIEIITYGLSSTASSESTSSLNKRGYGPQPSTLYFQARQACQFYGILHTYIADFWLYCQKRFFFRLLSGSYFAPSVNLSQLLFFLECFTDPFVFKFYSFFFKYQ